MAIARVRAFVILTSSLVAGLAPAARAQQITLTPAVVSPGDPVTATVANDTGTSMFFGSGCELRVLRHSGELFSPTLIPPQLCDGMAGIPSGSSAVYQLTAPSEPGGYTVLFVPGNRAAARLIVGVPDDAPQQLAIYPSRVLWPQAAHQVDFANPDLSTWEIANTGAQPHTLGSEARVDLFTPGGTSPAASISLAGIHVPAGKVTAFTLPIAGLNPGPYSLEAFHDEPALARVVRTRSGIRDLGSAVELHMTTGHDLRPGGGLEMAISLSGFPASGTGPDPLYALLIGFVPGSTTLPGGVALPLVLDGLAAASLTGLGGLLVHNVGRVPNVYGPEAYFAFDGTVSGISLSHPGIPAVSGLELRMAVIGVDATLTTWGASQPEEFTIR